MTTNRARADNLIKSAQKLRRQAESNKDAAQSASLSGQATVDALLAVVFELRNAADSQGELNKILQRHGAVMEEAANTMLRAAK
jgi:hypothetical protein